MPNTLLNHCLQRSQEYERFQNGITQIRAINLEHFNNLKELNQKRNLYKKIGITKTKNIILLVDIIVNKIQLDKINKFIKILNT